MLHGPLEVHGTSVDHRPLGYYFSHVQVISSGHLSHLLDLCGLVLAQLYTTPSLVRWLAFRTEGEEQMGTRGLITILTESVLQSFVST